MVCTAHRLQCRTSHIPKHKFPYLYVINVHTNLPGKQLPKPSSALTPFSSSPPPLPPSPALLHHSTLTSHTSPGGYHASSQGRTQDWILHSYHWGASLLTGIYTHAVALDVTGAPAIRLRIERLSVLGPGLVRAGLGPGLGLVRAGLARAGLGPELMSAARVLLLSSEVEGVMGVEVVADAASSSAFCSAFSLSCSS